MSTHPLVVHTDKTTRKRELRGSEKIYKALMTKNFSADIQFYKMLVDNLDMYHGRVVEIGGVLLLGKFLA